jgi:hypothetical protein
MVTDDAILNELREQTKWLRLLGLGSVRPLITQVLTSDRDRLVYENTNGLRTAREVAKLAGVSHPTVLKLWQDWLALGICIESRTQSGRAEHLVPLSKLGIPVPKARNAIALETMPTAQEDQE